MKGALAVILAGFLMFFGAASYAVYNGQQENENICKAVNGLRADFVQVLTTLRDRSIRSAPRRGADPREVRETYDLLIGSIGDPECP